MVVGFLVVDWIERILWCMLEETTRREAVFLADGLQIWLRTYSWTCLVAQSLGSENLASPFPRSVLGHVGDETMLIVAKEPFLFMTRGTPFSTNP